MEKDIKLTFKDLKEEYLKDNIQMPKLEFWNKKDELTSSSAEKLLTSPDLVKLYITKYGLYSSSAEEKLLTSSDLVKLYITKYRLYSSSAAEKLLTSPDLVKLYITKYGLNDTIKIIIYDNS